MRALRRGARLGLAVVLFIAATSLHALEVEQGNLRLVLHEDSARFSLFVRERGEWRPLFVADDPRTSALDVLENNRVHRMGDSGDFVQRVEETEEGARFVWSSPTLEVIQGFAMTRGVTADDFDAVQMTVAVRNIGEEPSTVGVRLLLDTYLGESDNTHFVTPGMDQVVRERSLVPGPVNRYVATPAARNGFGFQYMIDDDAVTEPALVAVANWKRLTDSSWTYEVNETRNFNRLPYSINDSALLVVYESRQLARGDGYAIVAQLGNIAPQGYLSPDVARQTTGEEGLLDRLAEIVSEINALIASDEVDAAEVARLQSELAALAEIIRGR